jgi:hypothetical protein
VESRDDDGSIDADGRPASESREDADRHPYHRATLGNSASICGA